MPKKLITVNAEVDLKTKQALIKKAKEMRVTVSVVVRWALDSYLAAQSSQSKEQAA